MRGETADEVSAVKSLVDDVVEQHHDVCHLVVKAQVDDVEIVVGIQHVEVFNHLIICDVALAEAGSLVKHRQGISHAAVGLFGNHVECLLFIPNALFLCHHLEVVDDVGHGHALKVVNLTSGDDGGQNLVLLGGGQDKDHMCRRLFERFQKSVEGLCGEHVHLVDDEHLVFAHLRRYACLFHQCLDVFHRVVAGGVELKDVVGALLVESLATFALVAGFTVFCGAHTVDGFGKDSGAGGFSHTSRSAEQVGVCQFAAHHRILQCCGECRLSHHRVERHGAVFACRNDIFFHGSITFFVDGGDQCSPPYGLQMYTKMW